MKATNEMILLYHLPEETAKARRGVCLRMGIRVREIPPEQYHLPLGCLAGLPGFEPAEGDVSAQPCSIEDVSEMVVLKNFTSRRMDELFRQWRKAGLPPIALKAALTPHNANWDSVTLYRELLQEHQAMQEGRAAHPAPDGTDKT